jgi:hypothetical protein
MCNPKGLASSALTGESGRFGELELSVAAENEGRTRAESAARTNVSKMPDAFTSRSDNCGARRSLAAAWELGPRKGRAAP